MKYQKRFYREVTGSDLVSFNVRVRESDLCVLAHAGLGDIARRELMLQRRQLEAYIRGHQEFYLSFTPVACEESAPEIVRLMSEASFVCDVGPMAAVAGAVAQLVGRRLLEYSPEIIVENGGDIFLQIRKPRTVMIYAGESPFSMKLGLRVDVLGTPVGVATSSATVGHSSSLGRADGVTAVCSSAAFADGFATCFGNLVKQGGDFAVIEEKARETPGLDGLVVIIGSEMLAWGKVNLVKL